MAERSAGAETTPREAFVLVANYDSDVGYAWWLMESFWVSLAHRYHERYRMLLGYPSISRVPGSISGAPIEPVQVHFARHRWSDLWRQLRFIRTHRVRVLYFTDQRAWGLRYILFRLSGVRRIVVHDHTPGNRVAPRGIKAVAKRLLARTPGVAVDGVIAVSEFVRRRHLEVTLFPAHRCFVAENGLPSRPAATPVDVHAVFGIPSDRLVLVTVGRAHRVKGVELVLEALSQLVVRDGRRDVHLLHCGDGPDLDRFAQRAEALGVSGFATFAGRQGDIPGILAGCDLAIHASAAEVGYSLAVLEYMEAGLPVVVSDDPSVSAATESGVNGLTFAAGDAADAAAVLVRLLDDAGLRDRLGEQGRRAVQERFSLARTHAQLLQAMDTLLARGDR